MVLGVTLHLQVDSLKSALDVRLEYLVYSSRILISYTRPRAEANVSIVIVASLNAVRSLVQMKAICGRPGTALDPIGDHDRPFGLVCVHHSNAKRNIPLVL